MSNTEKDLVTQVTELPPEVQDKFLLLAQGAAMALDALRDAAAAGTEDGSSLIRPSGTFSQGKAEDGGAA